MVRAGRRYSAKLKFQVVLEALRGEQTPGQLAKQYGVHANSIGLWRKMLLERGPEVFTRQGQATEIEGRVADLERLLGQKEVEIALLKNFLGRGR